MKYFFLLICGLIPLMSYTQDIRIGGFEDLEMGKSFKSVKKLLKKKTIESYFFRSDEYYEKPEEEDCYLCAYEVKLKKKYKSIAGFPIHAIEVQFDEDQKISNILIMIEKTDQERTWDLYFKFMEKLGETFCSSGVDGPPTYFCMWNHPEEPITTQLYDWNGIGESDFDEFLWIEHDRLK